jgi:hypothetical protein
MVDWWQALLLVFAGGLAGLPTAYFVHRWTSRASREAEERQAKRRLEEQQRQAIRRLRRERMQPVLDFLDVLKQSVTSQLIEQVIEGQYDSLGPDRKLRPEEWKKVKSDLLEAEAPTSVQQARAFTLAVHASVTIPALQHELVRLYTASRTATDPKPWKEFDPALRSVEQLIEQYLAGAEPREPTVDAPSQET